MFSDPLTAKLAAFVRGVGIEVHAVALPDSTFLAGLDIRCGAVLIDESRLQYPGDVLHEAGHIAVTDPQLRNQPKLSPDGGDELANRVTRRNRSPGWSGGTPVCSCEPWGIPAGELSNARAVLGVTARAD